MNFKDLEVLQYDSFIMFNNTGTRLHPEDILYKGPGIVNIVEDIMFMLSAQQDLKFISIYNRVEKINKMLQNANLDDVMMTKFVSKIKGPYKMMSEIGEKFVNLNIYVGVFANSNLEDLLQTKTIELEIDDIDIEA